MATQGEATVTGARPKVQGQQEQVEPERRVRGPPLSTSTSSFEALDPHDPQLNHLASVMFSKSADWIEGELGATVEDYKLLEKMNRYPNSVSLTSLLYIISFI
jgi:hypothetical protein